jgi:hypothetical protein
MNNLRIGIGYDVHQFAESRDLILGGVKIEYRYGLKGILTPMFLLTQSSMRFWAPQAWGYRHAVPRHRRVLQKYPKHLAHGESVSETP